MEIEKVPCGKIEDYTIEMKSSDEKITHEDIEKYVIEKAKQKIEKHIGETSGRVLIEVTLPGEIENSSGFSYIRFFILAGSPPRGYILLDTKYEICKVLDKHFKPIYTFNRIYNSNSVLGDIRGKIWQKRFDYETKIMRKTGNWNMKDINYNKTPK